MKKKKVLILNGQYEPGYKGGGPIRSISNLIDNLNDKFEFFVLTSDRDFGEKEPYGNISYHCWQKIRNAKVYYMTPKEQSLVGFYRLINNNEYDLIYLNGFFSPIFTIKILVLRKLGLIKVNKILLSPRGDFSIGHLNIMKIKKYSYIFLTKIIGLYSGVFWQATSDLEINDIKRIYPGAKILMAPNLGKKIDNNKITSINKQKKKGELRIAFVSRIVKKKNLLYCLEILNNYDFNGNIQFDIYGPMKDELYFKECKSIINDVKENIKINYFGSIVNDKIVDTLKDYHCFFFPTLGENFGHVIVEALISGCILLLSDQTPWRNLNKYGVGWDLDLKDTIEFKKAIDTLLDMDDNDMKISINNIEKYAIKHLKNENIVKKNLQMFEVVCNGN